MTADKNGRRAVSAVKTVPGVGSGSAARNGSRTDGDD